MKPSISPLEVASKQAKGAHDLAARIDLDLESPAARLLDDLRPAPRLILEVVELRGPGRGHPPLDLRLGDDVGRVDDGGGTGRCHQPPGRGDEAASSRHGAALLVFRRPDSRHPLRWGRNARMVAFATGMSPCARHDDIRRQGGTIRWSRGPSLPPPTLGSRGAAPAGGAPEDAGGASRPAKDTPNRALARACPRMASHARREGPGRGPAIAATGSARHSGLLACGRMSPRCDRCPSSSACSPRVGGRTFRPSWTRSMRDGVRRGWRWS